MMLVQRVIDKLKNNKSFLITAHMNLEGDALGSELAIYLLLKRLGKKRVVICNNDPTPEIYGFLPSIDVIQHSIKDEKFDVALFLDCSDSSRAGWVKDAMAKAKSIINIDHHISNTYFGDVNWVDPKASSACQMIYKLCEKLKIIDKKIATCLYTGIFTDTGSFTYANTTPTTHGIIAKLIKHGVNPHHIDENLHSLCTAEDLNFISKVASNLKYDSRKKICWAEIKKWHDRGYDLTEIIFSVMRLLKDVEVLVLFKQLGRKKIRVNFRSRNYVDVNKIAQFFGGGGHKRASGTTIEDSMDRTRKKVIAFIKRYTNGKPRSKK